MAHFECFPQTSSPFGCRWQVLPPTPPCGNCGWDGAKPLYPDAQEAKGCSNQKMSSPIKADANSFAVGDLVSLKSGFGPTMTIVDSYSDGERLECAWWSSSRDKFEFSVFPIAALIKSTQWASNKAVLVGEK